MQSKLQTIVSKLLQLKELSEDKRKRFEIIQRLLEDEQCFFKIDTDTAYSILNDLGFSFEEATDIYKELINSKNYNKEKEA